MQSRIGLWGGSCAVRLPKMAVETLGLYEGETVSLQTRDGGLVIRPAMLCARRSGCRSKKADLARSVRHTSSRH